MQWSWPVPDAAASSRLRVSHFSRSLQRRLQVHRQQARPHPDFRRLFSFIPDIPDPRAAEVLFAVPDRTFDPVSFFLLFLEPAVRPRRLRPSPQRFILQIQTLASLRSLSLRERGTSEILQGGYRQRAYSRDYRRDTVVWVPDKSSPPPALSYNRGRRR